MNPDQVTELPVEQVELARAREEAAFERSRSLALYNALYGVLREAPVGSFLRDVAKRALNADDAAVRARMGGVI